MNIIIAGGGKLGYYLAQTLLPLKHKVFLIEKDKEYASKLATMLNISVIYGDCTMLETFEQFEVDKCDAFIAVTGKDEVNIVACQLAKNYFRIHKTIARVNNPKNYEAFEKLGVDQCVSSTALIAQMIEREVDYDGFKVLSEMDDEFIMVETVVRSGTPVWNKMLKEIKEMKYCSIAVIRRQGTNILPNGETQLHSGDKPVIVVKKQNINILKKIFFK